MPTQQACHLIGFLLLNGLVVQCLEEHVQHKDVVSAKEDKNDLFVILVSRTLGSGPTSSRLSEI